MQLINDEYYMDLALNLARGAEGQTGVNPAVGCVIVKDGRIVGMGAHLKMGTAHAEVHALNMAGAEAAGSTAYVTLEPCSHHGRTPPCSDRLVAEGVARVVVACTDPNPRVAGTGLARLREHGIAVTTGVRKREAVELNEPFNKYIRSRLPFVTLKTASTLDGKIASRTGDSRWITNERSRAFVHTLRHRNQAILVGVGTVLADDPQLNARLPVPGLDPVKVIVDSALRTPPNARAFEGGARVIVITTAAGLASPGRAALEARGAEVIAAGEGPRVDLAEAMRLLGEREIGSVLLEGGGRLNGAMLEQGLIDKCHLFFAPKIIGGGAEAPGTFSFGGFALMKDAIRLDRIQVETFGEDFLITGYPIYETGNG